MMGGGGQWQEAVPKGRALEAFCFSKDLVALHPPILSFFKDLERQLILSNLVLISPSPPLPPALP